MMMMQVTMTIIELLVLIVYNHNTNDGSHRTESYASQAATPGTDYQTAVAIGSLQGKDMLLRITKRPGHEMDDVLDSPSERGESLWGRLTSWATKPNPLAVPALGTGAPPSTSVCLLSTPACLSVSTRSCLSRAVLPIVSPIIFLTES